MSDITLPSRTAERYALALEAINEAVYDYDATTGAIYYAPQLGAMLGLGPDDLRTVEDWTSRIHPDDLASYRRAWRALFSGEQARLDCQYRYRAGDGKWHWAHQHGIALRNETGRVQRVVGATGDITELREAQELQVATSEILRTISRADFDLETVLRTMVRTAAELTRADGAIFWRYRDGAYHYAAGHLLGPALESIERATPIEPGEETLVGRAALRQSTVQIEDAWTDPTYGPKEDARLGGFRSMLAVPVSREGVPIGMFSVARCAVDPFTPRQISLVSSFADQAVIATENARLIAELRQRTAELEEALRIRVPVARSARHQQFATRSGPRVRRHSGKSNEPLRRGSWTAVAVRRRSLSRCRIARCTAGICRLRDPWTGQTQCRDDARAGRHGPARSLSRRYPDGVFLLRRRAARCCGRRAWRLSQHDHDPTREGSCGARLDVAVSPGGEAVFRKAAQPHGGLRGTGGHRAGKRADVRRGPTARG